MPRRMTGASTAPVRLGGGGGRCGPQAGAERATRLVEPRLAQLRAGRAVAELLARGLAVPGPDHVAQVRLALERVAVLLRVALGRAQVGRRGELDRRRLLEPALGDVDRPRPVAGLALHVAQLVVVPQVRAARLVPAGDVAADALEIELLAPVLEGLP